MCLTHLNPPTPHYQSSTVFTAPCHHIFQGQTSAPMIKSVSSFAFLFSWHLRVFLGLSWWNFFGQVLAGDALNMITSFSLSQISFSLTTAIFERANWQNFQIITEELSSGSQSLKHMSTHSDGKAINVTIKIRASDNHLLSVHVWPKKNSLRSVSSSSGQAAFFLTGPKDESILHGMIEQIKLTCIRCWGSGFVFL
jgi:hypothetical protein